MAVGIGQGSGLERRERRPADSGSNPGKYATGPPAGKLSVKAGSGVAIGTVPHPIASTTVRPKVSVAEPWTSRSELATTEPGSSVGPRYVTRGSEHVPEQPTIRASQSRDRRAGVASSCSRVNAISLSGRRTSTSRGGRPAAVQGSKPGSSAGASTALGISG